MALEAHPFHSTAGSSRLSGDDLFQLRWAALPWKHTFYSAVTRATTDTTLSSWFVLLPKYSQLPVISHSPAFIFLILAIISFASDTSSSPSSVKKYSQIAWALCMNPSCTDPEMSVMTPCFWYSVPHHPHPPPTPNVLQLSKSSGKSYLTIIFFPWCNVKGQLPCQVINGNYCNY